jgi:hypothetical protein
MKLLRCISMLFETLHGRDPGRLPYECCDFLHIWLNCRKDLDAGGPIADESNMLAFQVHSIIPVGCMQEGAFVFVEPRDSRPLPCVQDPSGIDQNVAVVVDDLVALHVQNTHVISSLFSVPVGSVHLVKWLTISPQTMLLAKVVEVVEYLSAAGVNCRPVMLGFERPGVVMCRDVACAARVLVFPPCPRDLSVLLVDDQVEVAEASLQFVREEQARCSSPDANYPYMSFRMNGPVSTSSHIIHTTCVARPRRGRYNKVSHFGVEEMLELRTARVERSISASWAATRVKIPSLLPLQHFGCI